MSGLCALQAYDSSETDSSDDENCQQDQCKPELGLGLHIASNDGEGTLSGGAVVVESEGGGAVGSRLRPNRNESNGRNTLEYLPLPDEVMSMFSGKAGAANMTSSEHHHGRVRSFAHEAGNWATYIYVPIKVTSEFEDLVDALIHCIPAEYNMQPMDTLHLSVSRTVTLKYHWIRPFTESVGKRLATLPRFVCAFGKPHIYVNDEATRSFVSLTIGQGVNELQDVVKEVDLALDEFNLPSFYKPPSFHVSIGWCLGDLTELISTALMSDLERCFLEHFSSITSVWNVTSLSSKIGNKYFTFALT